MENWADLLPFVPRHQLVKLLLQLGDSDQLPPGDWAAFGFVPRRLLVPLPFQFGDRQFVSILQKYLNEVGHVTLGHLRIEAAEQNHAIDGPIVEVCEPRGIGHNMWPIMYMETAMPDEPIPKNVHNFKSLTLRFLNITIN
jgi:hypothetical protein